MMKRQDKECKFFLGIVLIVPTILICLIAIINFIIDPFYIYQNFSFEQLNRVKTELIKHERLYKAIEIARLKPQAILLGSSRVAVGLDPEDVKEITGLFTYNSGLSMAGFEEMYHYFEHALHHQPNLKVVILGLDFFAFSKKSRPQSDFHLDRLKSAPIVWRDRCSSLLSWQALASSYATYKKNQDPFSFSPILPHGQTNPLLTATPASNPILEKGELRYIKMILDYDYKHYQLDEKKIELFQRLVQLCHQHSIELKVFFCPSKAIYWEALYRQQLWPTFEKLKRQLSTIHPIWDFSGFNCLTMETLSHEYHPLYFECSHFQPHIGKLLLKKMFNLSHPSLNFGDLLTPHTIEQAFISNRLRAEKWLNTHYVIEQIHELPLLPW